MPAAHRVWRSLTAPLAFPAAFAAASILTGCVASHEWAPGPGMGAAEFEQAKARCSLEARHSGSGFAAIGSPAFVGAAALGATIGSSNRTQQDFNDCMLAGGWRIADQLAAAAPQDQGIARLTEIRAELTACINVIRAKPTYASLQPHLIDLNTGRYTMAQLADERIPTPEESRLLTAYVDERASCTDNFVTAGSQILPVAAPILAQEKSDGQAVLLLLVKRQLTWGEAAQRSQQLQEAAAAKLRSMTLPTLGPSASTPPPAPVTATTPVAGPGFATAQEQPQVSSASGVSPDYRAVVSAWLENHKRYPFAARQRGEEGRAVLHFKVDRSGHVVDFAVAQSTGYSDLDASIEDMMRGAVLPPFPASMTQSRIDVSATIRFSLAQPAPVAPATPSAAPASAIVTATSTPQPAARTVASGERQRIGFFYTLNPDCTPAGYMTVRVITSPAHGELTAEQGVNYTNYPKENQRYQCNLKKSPVTDVYYKSNSGYLGTDSTLIEAASPTGTTITRIYTITVR
jgi:TonB family protein